MKKIWALVLAAAVFVTMTGCGKNSSNAEDAAIRDEIMGELSDADKEDIKQIQEELNGDYNEENSEEQAEEEVFTPEDFPCDPKVLNSKWSDCYYQVADVVVQEYHNVPIMDVINSFEESKLKFAPGEDFDPEKEFPYNRSEDTIRLNSPHGYYLDLVCGINMDEGKDVVKIKDATFLYISYINEVPRSYSKPWEFNSYVSKGFCVSGPMDKRLSDYSVRDVDKFIDDDMVELDESESNRLFGNQFGKELLELNEEKAWYRINDKFGQVIICYLIPSDISTGGPNYDRVCREYVFHVGDNNRYYCEQCRSASLTNIGI